MYRKYFKRFLDIICSSSLIIFLFPVMILQFLLIWIVIGFPIFKQKRPGLNNKFFTLYKFKTLYEISRNKHESKRKNILGNFMRKSGLDELPQLFNVLINDMSLVGPRPLLVKYLKIKGFRKHIRKKCKPGITGLAQIQNFTNLKMRRRKSKWIEQFNLDHEYYKRMSFKLDAYILIKTFLSIFIRKKIDFHREPSLLSKHFK